MTLAVPLSMLTLHHHYHHHQQQRIVLLLLFLLCRLLPPFLVLPVAEPHQVANPLALHPPKYITPRIWFLVAYHLPSWTLLPAFYRGSPLLHLSSCFLLRMSQAIGTTSRGRDRDRRTTSTTTTTITASVIKMSIVSTAFG